MSLLALVLSLPVAVAGAYYLVNAGAAGWLGTLEGQQANCARVRLRRVNGLVMLLMSVALYLAIARSFDLSPGRRPGLVAPLAWIAICPLLVVMLVLAWLDVRLTRRLRRDLLRKAAMNGNQNRSSGGARGHGAGQQLALALAVSLATAAGLGGAMGCDQASRGDNGSQPAAGPASRPAGPTTRATDGPRPAEGRPQQLRSVHMKLGRQVFAIEVADTDAERQHGMMFRKSIPEDSGMLFIYPEEQYLSFWMKNTFIPLDIAFLTEDGRIVNIEQMAAHDLRGVESTQPAKYALELPLGAAKRVGLEPGMRLELPENARDPDE